MLLKNGAKNKKKRIKRGDIYYANLTHGVGSEQKGCRPVLIVSNNIGNAHSPTVIIVPITGNPRKNPIPTHVEIPRSSCLGSDSLALIEQIRTIDRLRLRGYIGRAGAELMSQIDTALAVGIGLMK